MSRFADAKIELRAGAPFLPLKAWRMTHHRPENFVAR
jgi:hypothetical protein